MENILNKIKKWLLNFKEKLKLSRDTTINLLVAILLVLLTPYITDIYEKTSKIWETDIVGKWDEEKAKSIVLEKLEKHDWSGHENICTEKDCHKVIDRTFTIVKSNNDSKILIGDTNPGNGCGSCYSLVSIFEFQSTSIGWELIVTDIGKIYFGSMNYTEVLEKDNIEFKEVAKDRLAIFISEYWNLRGGKHAQAVSAYVKVGSEYENFLDLIISCDNSGTNDPTTDLSTNFEFIPTSIGLYRLKTDTSGEIDAKSYSNSQIFDFNGKGYFSEDQSFGCEPLI